MTKDDIRPEKPNSQTLSHLAKEDLEPYSTQDLRLRIEALNFEIKRTHAAIDTKAAKLSAAEALFRFKAP
jgi:uncharacterized small protein (DUF1192 family)